MKCSDCSQIVRPIVAVDIDGTLGDYHGHFLEFASAYFDQSIHCLYNGVVSFRASTLAQNEWMTDKDWHDAKLAYRQGGMKRTMPIFDGAKALCWGIRVWGAELWLTTTRPYLSLDNIVPDTVEWCRRHGIEYDGMLFDEDKYTQLSARVDTSRVVAVLDDLPEMYDAAATVLHYGWDVPILVRNAYNSGVKRPMIKDLEQCYDIVSARVRQWRGRHDGHTLV